MLLFEAPKISPPVLIFLKSVSFASSVYSDNIHNSLLMAIQKVYLICVLLLISGFFILSHSRFILLGGVQGGGGVSQLIWVWDTRGSHPKKFIIKRGGLHVLQELPVNFHQLRLPHKKWTISYQNSLQVMWVGWQVVGSFLA